MEIGDFLELEICAAGTGRLTSGPPTLADAILAGGKRQIEKAKIAKDVKPRRTMRRLRSGIGLIPSGIRDLLSREAMLNRNSSAHSLHCLQSPGSRCVATPPGGTCSAR